MAEIGERNPYQEAVRQFESLEGQPFSPTEHLARLMQVQSAGFTTGVDHPQLFSALERMAGAVVKRASEIPNNDAVLSFSSMQKGYQNALDRVTKPLASPKAPATSRPRSGVAAG
jgi:hypothetical protein